MRVRVRLRREAGAARAAYGLGHSCTGDLFLTYRTAGSRRVAVLQLLGADRAWPNLMEPRVVALGGQQLVFVGYERHDKAWVLQEWECEVIPAG